MAVGVSHDRNDCEHFLLVTSHRHRSIGMDNRHHTTSHTTDRWAPMSEDGLIGEVNPCATSWALDLHPDRNHAADPREILGGLLANGILRLHLDVHIHFLKFKEPLFRSFEHISRSTHFETGCTKQYNIFITPLRDRD